MKKSLKKNLVKKSILPAAFAVMGSAIALTSVSYAWFTTGKNGSVEQFDVNIAAVSGLELSTDAEHFHSTITQEEIGKITTNQLPKTYNPVSTSGTLDDTTGLLDMFHATESNGTLTATDCSKLIQEGGNFTAFDLYARITDDKATFKLDEHSLCVGKNGDEIGKTARIAFINLGNAERPTEAKALTGKANELKPGIGKTFIWEPFAAEHTSFADANYAAQGFGSSLGAVKVDTYGLKSTFENIQISALKGDALKTQVVKTETIKYQGEKGTLATYGQTQAQADLFEIYKGINKIRIYIWIEGQDIDCNNDVSNTDLYTKFNFAYNPIK